jgi:signal transduction histidine kinase
MRLNIKTKQVLGVTSTVGAVVVALSLYHLGSLARYSLEESKARGLLLSRAIYQRTQGIAPRASDPYTALRQDAGLKSILESSIYSRDVTYAAIVDPSGTIMAHSDPSRIGRRLPALQQVDDLIAMRPLRQVWLIFTDPGRNVEVQERLMLGSGDFGAIRIGISTLLVRRELERALRPAIGTVLGALIIATLMAMLLAQLFLRPIHVIKSGLTRLQRGETGVTFDLPKDEFGDLGMFFSAVSDKLSADRTALAGQKANLETVVERLEDAVAIFNGSGELLFANPAMRALAPQVAGGVDMPAAWRELVQKTLASRQSHGPVSMQAREAGAEEDSEWLVSTHVVEDVDHRLVGVMLTGRNLDALANVQSTLRYSSKLTALGRLSAGVAHEVKNPLNAMMIHLELLRQKLSGGRPVQRAAARGETAAATAGGGGGAVATVAVPADLTGALDHVSVISNEIKRLDQVLQGFLRFTRPEDLRLQPVDPAALLEEVARVIQGEAPANGVRVEVHAPPTVLYVNGDAGMLRQAILNLALNACQAMPGGGVLRFGTRRASKSRVELSVEDTGTGIQPEHLQRIFDLYFTTRPKGTGIGLSMVYRTVQLHDGDIEVQSTPGVGTAFRVLIPEA